MPIIWRPATWNRSRLNWEENTGSHFEYIPEGIKWPDFKEKKNRTGYAVTNLPLGKIKVTNNNFIHNRTFPKADFSANASIFYL